MRRALLVIGICVGLIVGFWAGAIYLYFGTLSPCGVLRETVRRVDPMVALLPDSVVDFALTAQYGALSPGRCIDLLLNSLVSQPKPVQPPTQPATPPQSRTPMPPTASVALNPQDAMKLAVTEMELASNECRAKRLRGELPSYVASANCSNPRIIEAFARARYRYMDLVQVFTSKRLEVAGRQDRNQLTEDQANAEILKAYASMVEDERRRDSR